jgi:cytoskeletal protein CcmA (bactofilin family)
MDAPIRVRYFGGEALLTQDFIDEQLYHKYARENFRGGVFRRGGVIEGLEVLIGADGPPPTVSVASGMALDGLGRSIVLAEQTTVVLDKAEEGKRYFLTVKYGERVFSGGHEDLKRIAEEPVFVSSESYDPDSQDDVLLGVIEISDGKVSAVQPEYGGFARRKHVGAVLGAVQFVSEQCSPLLRPPLLPPDSNPMLIAARNDADTGEPYLAIAARNIVLDGDVIADSVTAKGAFSGDFTVEGSLKGAMGGPLMVSGDLEIDGKLQGQEGSLTIVGDADISKDLTVVGGATVGGDLEIDGKLQGTGGSLTINGDATITKDLTIGGGATLDGGLELNGTSLQGNGGSLTIAGDATVTKDLTVTGGAKVDGDLEVDGQLLGTGGSLTISGDVEITKDLTIGGGATLYGDLELNGALQGKSGGSLTIAGDAIVTKDLTVAGGVKVDGDVEVDGSLKGAAGGKLNVSGDMTVSSDLTVSNDLVVDGYVNASTLIGPVTIKDSLTVNGDLTVKGKIINDSQSQQGGSSVFGIISSKIFSGENGRTIAKFKAPADGIFILTTNPMPVNGANWFWALLTGTIDGELGEIVSVASVVISSDQYSKETMPGTIMPASFTVPIPNGHVITIDFQSSGQASGPVTGTFYWVAAGKNIFQFPV